MEKCFSAIPRRFGLRREAHNVAGDFTVFVQPEYVDQRREMNRGLRSGSIPLLSYRSRPLELFLCQLAG